MDTVVLETLSQVAASWGATIRCWSWLDGDETWADVRDSDTWKSWKDSFCWMRLGPNCCRGSSSCIVSFRQLEHAVFTAKVASDLPEVMKRCYFLIKELMNDVPVQDPDADCQGLGPPTTFSQ